MSHINELISYIDQLLNAIDQGSINSNALLAKTNRVGSSIDSGGGLLEKVLKRSNRRICKGDIMSKLNREMRKLVIDLTNQGWHVQWLGIALLVLGFVLKSIRQVSSSREECIELFKYMCNLAKYIRLDDHLPQEKLNQVLQFIVLGSLLCISQMESHALSKFFTAPVAAEDLGRFQAGLIHECPGLSLEAIIPVLNRIQIWLGIALSVVGFALERIGQVSCNRGQCIKLLKYRCNLAKYIKQLDEHLPRGMLSRVLQFIAQSSFFCISQIKFHVLSKFFTAAAEDLQAGLIHELSLETIIAVLNRIPVVLAPSQGRFPQAVDIQEAINDVNEFLDMKSESIKVVVIYEEGGMGKTSLTTVVFSKFDLKNYKYCKVDIEMNCPKTNFKLLQQQILKDLYDCSIELRNLNESREEMSKGFLKGSSQPVIIFVDNALKQSDLEKLLPISDLASLPAQNRMLVMCRNLNETSLILEEGVECCHYPVASLPQEEARKLLCGLALGSGQPGFNPTIDINGLLQICQGVPLVLNMAGERLREHAQSVPACRDTVENLKSGLLQGVECELSERMVYMIAWKPLVIRHFLPWCSFFYNWKQDLVASSVGETEFRELERVALVNITNESKVNVHDIAKARERMLSADGDRITDLPFLTDVLQDFEFLGIPSSLFLPARGHYAKA